MINFAYYLIFRAQSITFIIKQALIVEPVLIAYTQRNVNFKSQIV